MMKYILILLLFVSGSVFAQYPGPYYPQGSNYEYRGKIKFNAPTWFLDSALFNGYTRVVTMGSSDSSRAAASTAFVKNQTSASTWKLFGNYTPIDPTQYRLGFLDSTPLIIINNGDTSLVVPAAGVNRASSARHKFLTIDTLNKSIYYTDGGAGGGGPTSGSGTTVSGTDVNLGGALTANTLINGAFDLNIGQSTDSIVNFSAYASNNAALRARGVAGIYSKSRSDLVSTTSDLIQAPAVVVFGTDSLQILNLDDAGSNMPVLVRDPASSRIYKMTAIVPSDTSAFSRKQMTAYSIRAKKTNAAADATNFTYKSFTNLTYAGTVTWTHSGSAPSGTPVVRYSWSQIGKDVTVSFTCYYPTAGTSVTAATFTLPTDMPLPLEPTGTGATDDVLYAGTGFITTNYATEPTIAGRAFLKVNTGDTGYEFKVVSSSVSARYAPFTLQYKAQ